MIFGVDKGIICQQVNCQNTIGAGLSGAIGKAYPVVNEKYHEAFTKAKKEDLFGKVQLVKVEEELYIANLFTQFYYGNSKKTHQCYTDTDKLINAIDKLAEKSPDKSIYIPAYIGCGLAGGNWSEVTGRLFSLERPNLIMLDTNKEPYLQTSLYIPQLSLREDFPVNIDPELYVGRILSFDTETTGTTDKDEVLQLSIINDKEETVLSSYFQPTHTNRWDKAMEINHITPEMVKNAPSIKRYTRLITEIFDKADTLVAHNASFDVGMLERAGVDIDKEKVFCTCNYFKNDHSSGHHSLMDAVKYYCPQATDELKDGSHEALCDATAALRVYLAIRCREDYEFDLRSVSEDLKGSDISRIYHELCQEMEKDL